MPLASSVAKGKILTGARTIFSLDAQIIGWCTGVRWSNAYQYEAAMVIGNVEVFEHVPVGYTCEFSASNFRISGTTLRTMGFLPKLGSSPDEHLNNLLALGALSATIEDTKTNLILAQFVNVKVATSSVGVDSRGLMAEDVSFVATRAFDEAEAA